MRLKHLTAVILGATTTLGATAAMAELKVDAYGSLRIQAESVSVDKLASDNLAAGDSKSYSGLKDAYSRFGVNASYPLAGGTTLGAKIEIPFNSASLEAEDPSYFEGFYKENNAPRVAKLTASGDWGSLAAGMQWLAYYNNIGYPVDYFSSFYSGFATHATFRREAVTYTTPSIAGFKFTGSAVDMVHGDNDYLDSSQFVASYSANGLGVALAYQDDYVPYAGAEKNNILGASASYTTGAWRFAGKVEKAENKSNLTSAVYNLYGSYALGNYTFKAHYASSDDTDTPEAAFFTGDSLHLGTDYQYTKNLKVFVEYFTEQNGYAIYREASNDNSGRSGYDPLGGAKSNGQAVVLGARYDF